MIIKELINELHFESLQTKSILNDTIYRDLILHLGGLDFTDSFLVTATWQILLESHDLKEKLYHYAMQYHTHHTSSFEHLEKYIWCLPNNKYYLLIFDPFAFATDPINFDAAKDNSEISLQKGYEIWLSKFKKSIIKIKDLEYKYRSNDDIFNNTKLKNSEINSLYSDKLFSILNFNLFYKFIRNLIWPVIVIKPPIKVHTSLVPNVNHLVRLYENSGSSLVGTYASNIQGIFGATICRHSFDTNRIEIGTTQASLNGNKGIIISDDPISDSCFVQLDLNRIEVSKLRTTNGPLFGKTPRGYESCSFINRNGNEIKTKVTGWSPDILNPGKYNQIKIFTDADTNPGDSGTALIDSENNILGFSFYRTGINADHEFSAWISGASVYSAHKLKFS